MAKIDTSAQKIEDFLERGVKEIITLDEVSQKLSSGKMLRVKHGVDPTGQDLHLGHASIYFKLRDLQQMGHKIVFLMGGFTGRFGDPTQELKSRTLRSKKEIETIAKDYIAQIAKILDVKKLEIRNNSEWYDNFSAEDLLKLMSNFTVEQVLERDMFQARKNKNLPIQFHEPVYPVLQGYDSVRLKSDLTIIGSDQVFNENFGRQLQKKFDQQPQSIVALNLLVGLDGQRKMGKSLHNFIALNESAQEQFGKIMSLPDQLITSYFTSVTRLSLAEIKEMSLALEQKTVNPRDLKLKLAGEIIGFFHSPKKAAELEKDFIATFSNKQNPAEMPEIKLTKASLTLLELIVASKLVQSKNEARRLIASKAVDLNQETKTDPQEIISLDREMILKIGKHRFIKIRPYK